MSVAGNVFLNQRDANANANLGKSRVATRQRSVLRAGQTTLKNHDDFFRSKFVRRI